MHVDSRRAPETSLYVPGGHFLHASIELRPVSGWKEPAGHSTHSVLAMLANVPALQGRHVDCPGSVDTSPLAQGRQVVELAAYQPGSHAAQTLEELPACPEYTLPSGHSTHESKVVAPLDVPNRPGGQARHEPTDCAPSSGW